MKTRRGFLKFLGGAAAIAADPDLLTWKPGARVYSIPAVVRPNAAYYRTLLKETGDRYMYNNRRAYSMAFLTGIETPQILTTKKLVTAANRYREQIATGLFKS